MTVQGTCDPKFAAVHEEFEENLASRGEVGASVCVTVDGETVVDLWGGVADPATGRAWERGHHRRRCGRARRARPRCAPTCSLSRGQLDLNARGHRLLARVRQERQGRRHRAHAARAPGRPRGAPRAAARGRPQRLGSRGRPARRPGAAVGARHASRLPRASPSVTSSARSCAASPGSRSARSSATKSRSRSASTSGSACPRSSMRARRPEHSRRPAGVARRHAADDADRVRRPAVDPGPAVVQQRRPHGAGRDRHAATSTPRRSPRSTASRMPAVWRGCTARSPRRLGGRRDRWSIRRRWQT